MTDSTATLGVSPKHPLDNSSSKILNIVLACVILAGAGWAASQLIGDLDVVRTTSIFPYLLLGLALFIALGFEFVNGFHDTANAVATVIYTHSLPANVAVVWSGTWNLLGVLASSGAVAFTIVSLLPVELILQVGSSAGFAMVFALLIAAIIWNLGTWWLGLPSSSSHTLIGSVIGVGLMNQIMGGPNGTCFRLRSRRRAAVARQDLHPYSQALYRAGRHQAAAVFHSRLAGCDVHLGQLLPRLQ
jgi:hypothetical protein